jgi:Zn-dependent protease
VSDFPRQGQPRRDWPISSTFLVLIAACLACAVWIVWRPEQARLAVFAFVLLGFLISLCLHEFGHAIVAYWCGDHSVRDSGYLTLNPLLYADATTSIVFPLLVMAIGGIGLPGGAVYIRAHLLRRRIYGALVSAAGPLATAIFLAMLMGVLKLQSVAAAPNLYAALAMLAMLEITMLVFNGLPWPGLDGWGIVEPFLPNPVRQLGRRVAPIAPIVLLVALFLVPAVNNAFWTAVDTAGDWIGLDWLAVRRGFALFRFWQ